MTRKKTTRRGAKPPADPDDFQLDGGASPDEALEKLAIITERFHEVLDWIEDNHGRSVALYDAHKNVEQASKGVRKELAG